MTRSARFRYSTLSPSQDEFDSLPRLPIVLRLSDRSLEAWGLVDSGATINVLPHELGVRLGARWDESKATLQVRGSLGDLRAQPLRVHATVSDLEPAVLVFAWVDRDEVPLILGQTNFFMEFDVCFYRSRLEFEVRRRS